MTTTNKGRLLARFNDLPFRRKLIVTYCIILLIPILGVMMLLNSQASTRQSNQTLTSIRIQVDEYIDKIGQRADQAEMSIRLFAHDQRTIDILQQDYSDFYYFAKEYLDFVLPTFTMIRYITPELQQWKLYTNGPLQAYRTFTRPVSLLEDEPWYEDAIALRRFVWYVQDGQLCLGIRQPDTYFANRINFIVFQYSMNSFFEGIDLVGLDHRVQVLDAEEQVVYDRGTLLDVDFSGAPPINGAQSESFRVGRTGYTMMGGRLAFRGWQIRYFIPTNALGPAVNGTFVLLLLLLLSGGVALAATGIALSSNLIRRMEALNERVKSIVTTGALQDLRAEAKDEIGELSNSVATMVEETQRLTREMYESRLALREAEFMVLQTQIKPHFLYNSLSLINWRAIKKGDHEISQMALMLTQFYRTMLNQGRTMTTAREEWLNMEAYLHIQMLFHNRNFETDLYLDEHIAEYPVPNLILQPLVENSIEHGLDKLRDTAGLLWVRGGLAGDMIRFEVRDNGPGFSAESLDSALTTDSPHYCLKNIDERLRLVYGDAYRFTLGNREEGGAVVVVELPMAGPRMQHVPLLRVEQDDFFEG